MFAQIVRNWNEMSTYRKIRRVVMIGLFFFGLWALTPYLYNRQVDEAFPAAAPAAPAPAATVAPAAQAMADAPAQAATAMPAMAEAATAMPAMAEAATAMPAMADAPVQAPAPTAVPAGPVALGAGTLIAGSFPGDRAEGKATIYRLEDNRLVLRLEDFKTTNGPDLFVTLHPGANPEQDKGEYLQVAALKGNQGNQNYDLPSDIDLSKYKSVVIWCRTFNIVFGYATLQNAS